MSFAQESLKMIFANHGETALADGGSKKGTIIFTGTLGALRTNPQFAAYGASRAGVRMLAQSLAKEYSAQGVHVVHTIANGGIKDEDGEAQKTGKAMSAEAVGRTYLWLSQQEPELWTHELGKIGCLTDLVAVMLTVIYRYETGPREVLKTAVKHG